MVVFDRPVGAQADAKELEYISALHQTGEILRPDGSIRDEDIKTYLRSRFGIEVSLEEVRQTILQGFGGSDGEAEVIDLMELIAIILIPLLLKAAAMVKGQELPPNSVEPPEQLLETAVQIILHDVTGSCDNPQELSADFLIRVLTVYGETEMAHDESLIQEMIQAATVNRSSGKLDARTFAEGLTKDVQLYDIANDVRISTSVQDVFDERKITATESDDCKSKISGSTGVTAGASANLEEVLDAKKQSVRQIETLHHIFTAPAIDIQAGTYRSKALTVSLWGCVLFGIFSTTIDLQTSGVSTGDCDYESDGSWAENVEAILCQLGSSILGWLIIFGFFSFAGVGLIGLGSLGNYVGHTRWYLPLFGAGSAVAFLFAFRIMWDTSNPYSYYISLMSIICAIMVAYLHLCHFISIIFSKVDFENSKWGRRFGIAALERELFIEAAGAHKSSQLVNNAMTLMRRQASSSVFKTYFGHGLSEFTVNGVSKKKTGGFLWLWRKIRDRSIFEKEGIWYSTRLVASNFAQLSITLFIILLGASAMKAVKENYGESKAQMVALVDSAIDTGISKRQTEEAAIEMATAFGSFLLPKLNLNCSAAYTEGSPLVDQLCTLDDSGLYNCSGIESANDSLCALNESPDLFEQDPAAAYQLMGYAGFNTSHVEDTLLAQFQAAVETSVESMYPDEEYMLTVPLGVAIAVAIYGALRLAVLYLPGVTATVLELRSGVIPSLKSADFQKYREAPDTVAMLTGSLFWGCLVSSLLFGLVVGFVVFLFLWQGSVYLAMKFCAIAVGCVCIILIRLLIVVVCCRRGLFKGLYRTRPAFANITMLALEWANFVFTAAFIFVRMFKILLIAMASIGQIDRKLLADGVGQLGPLEFDPFPTFHARDVVAHEAHRHPYIEILGTMYLMKLRYAKDFGSRAGSAWRLVFIYALLPWMHQYRLDGGPIEHLQKEEAVALTVSTQLPSFKNSMPMDNSAFLKAENKKLKNTVRQLSEQLRGSQVLLSAGEQVEAAGAARFSSI